MLPLTGWMFTDAVRQVGCPKCGAAVETDCRTPSGRKKWPPHAERVASLAKKVGSEPYRRTIT